jgi:LPPG:FO 2-phospho-L-lactate transferase
MKIAVLTGGVGGAKFVLGLKACGRVDDLIAIVNTGDDFRHLGLHVSPDIDTLLYTLSGQDNKEQGWGRAGETWSFLDAVRSLGGPGWFRLGDGDLALHVLRTQMLAEGRRLSDITAGFALAWKAGAKVLPMSDEPVATYLDTDCGDLEFQRYFVERRCQPVVRSIRFDGAPQASAAPGVKDAILSADAVFLAPSNPYLSIDPILAIADIAQGLRDTTAPVVAISPLVGGKAVKGPTAKLMAELGVPVDNDAIADHYAGLLDGMLHDSSDLPPRSVAALGTDTLMRDLADKRRVAEAALALASAIEAGTR